MLKIVATLGPSSQIDVRDKRIDPVAQCNEAGAQKLVFR